MVRDRWGSTRGKQSSGRFPWRKLVDVGFDPGFSERGRHAEPGRHDSGGDRERDLVIHL